MRIGLRSAVFSAAIVGGLGLVHTSGAVVRAKGGDAPHVDAARGGRAARTVAYGDPRGQLARAGLAGWSVAYDDDTLVPYRLWGSTPAIAHAVSDGRVAEAAARAFLADHLALLAPGATSADLVLLANQVGPAGIRTVTFAQHAQGIPVVGAAINFAFAHDRLVMVGSTAVPHVAAAIRVPQRALAPTALAGSAAHWLAKTGHRLAPLAAELAAQPAAPRAILPIIRPRVGAAPDIAYAVTDRVELAAPDGEVGSWTVYLDSDTGAPVARDSHVRFASTGTIAYDVADQSPTGGRSPHPVPLGNFTIDGGATASTDLDGVLTWDAASAVTVAPLLAGARVQIRNRAGSLVTGSFSLAPGGSATWSQATDELADAQLASFVYANTAKQFTKVHLNPDLAWLDAQMRVNVNESMTCNAFSEGDAVHFYRGDASCENTGRMADVVYHETGHSIHNQSVIPGAGAFEANLSEGLADTLAISITGDHGLGRGFFRNNTPLRDVAPATPKHWPEDQSADEHANGEIIGESLWDLRQALQTTLGQQAGYEHFLKLFYNIMQRSPDLFGGYLEALVADDDDGDLTNGTPNLCLIKAAFDRHGLADAQTTLGLQAPTRDGFTISVVTKPSPALAACGGSVPSVTSAQVAWRLRGATAPDATLDLTNTNDTFAGAIPTQPDGAVVEYKVTVALSTGDTVVYPNNPADPYYQFYVGTPTPIWCADFEAGAADWTHGGTDDEWEAGAPRGLGGDPKAAFEGSGVLGLDLSMDGLYADAGSSYAESPAIDLMGHTQHVHLQYQRWLGVEDGFYDQATIKANDAVVWANFASKTDPQEAEVNHLDREWRFQDVDVSAQAAAAPDGKLKLRFDLTSDQGLGFGGWTIDHVCLVATDAPGGGDNTAETPKDDGGCCSTSSSSPLSSAAGALALGWVLRRRRRNQSQLPSS